MYGTNWQTKEFFWFLYLVRATHTRLKYLYSILPGQCKNKRCFLLHIKICTYFLKKNCLDKLLFLAIFLLHLSFTAIYTFARQHTTVFLNHYAFEQIFSWKRVDQKVDTWLEEPIRGERLNHATGTNNNVFDVQNRALQTARICGTSQSYVENICTGTISTQNQKNPGNTLQSFLNKNKFCLGVWYKDS